MRVDSTKASGRILKLVVCEKCSCAYRYELVRSTRALPMLNFVKMIVCILAFPLLFILSLFRPIPLWNGRTLYLLRFQPAVRLRDSMMNTLREGGDEYAHIANVALREKLLSGVEPVPCPDCGWLQKEMVDDIRSRSLPILDVIGVAFVGVSQVGALWFMDSGLVVGFHHLVIAWCLWTLAGLTILFTMMLTRTLLTRNFNPNGKYPVPADPFPGAPLAIREVERQKEVVANTKQLLGSIRKQEVAFRPTAILPNSAWPGK